MEKIAKCKPTATFRDSLTLEECNMSTATKFVCSLYGISMCNLFNALWSEKADK